MGAAGRPDYLAFRDALLAGYQAERDVDVTHLDDFIALRQVAFDLWYTGTAQVNPRSPRTRRVHRWSLAMLDLVETRLTGNVNPRRLDRLGDRIVLRHLRHFTGVESQRRLESNIQSACSHATSRSRDHEDLPWALHCADIRSLAFGCLHVTALLFELSSSLLVQLCTQRG